MMRKCPDCRRYFPTKPKDEEMLAESFQRNPNLKFVCPPCGKKVEFKIFMAKRRK